MTLCQAVSKSLKAAGFKRVGSEQTSGVHRTWWDGPRFTMAGIRSTFYTDGFKVSSFQGFPRTVYGPGWELHKPDFAVGDEAWCLSIYRNNEAGRLEAAGIDAEGRK